MIHRLWDILQDDATFMRRVNGWLTMVWALMIPIALLTGWMESVIFVSAVSIYANLVGHWSAWQSARVEVKQDIQDDKGSSLLEREIDVTDETKTTTTTETTAPEPEPTPKPEPTPVPEPDDGDA